MFTIAADVQEDHLMRLKEERANLKRHGSDADANEGSSGEGGGAAKKPKGGEAANAEQVR